MTSFARQVQRRNVRAAAREYARSVPAEYRRTLFHGTIASSVSAIKREGLRAVYGPPPFLSDDADRAAGYALRAVCLDLHERGLAGSPGSAKKMAIITIRADVRELVEDGAHSGDYAAPDGVPAAFITGVRFIDAHYLVPPEAEVADYARRTLLAREIENAAAAARPYSEVSA